MAERYCAQRWRATFVLTDPTALRVAGTVPGVQALRAAVDTTFIPPYLVDVDPTRGELGCATCYAQLGTAMCARSGCRTC